MNRDNCYRFIYYSILTIGIWQFKVVTSRHVHSSSRTAYGHYARHGHGHGLNNSQTPLKAQPRILGGDEVAGREYFPYHVSIQVTDIHLCGGAIVDKRWVVTAAHCVMQDDFKILAGTHNLGDRKQAVYFTPEEVIVHCNYDYPEFTNDIALVRTVETIHLSSVLKALPLGMRFPFSNGKLILTGWGSIKNGDTVYDEVFPDLLHTLTFQAVSNKKCHKAWERSGGIDTGNACAYNDIGKGACSGDSGSPLVFHGKLVGIASYVMACARGLPDVFASVPFYLDFLRTTMRECEERAPEKTSKHQRTKIHRTPIRNRKDFDIVTHRAWHEKKMHVGRYRRDVSWGQRIRI